jgi:hypothetical protein
MARAVAVEHEIEPEIAALLADLERRLERRFGERFVALYLFGSRVRGDHEPDGATSTSRWCSIRRCRARST